MRLLITGAAGMLGAEVVPTLEHGGHRVFPTDIVRTGSQIGREAIAELDVRKPEAVRCEVGRRDVDCVIHLAALTSLEECEIDTDNAWHTNALGTKYVAAACRHAGIPMLYVSTAGVFDGTNTEPYTEFDTPNPINVYGRTKLAGERFCDLNNSWTVRAGWMMAGGQVRDHKFVSLICNQIDLGAKTIQAVDDKFGSPTYGPDLAAGICALVESETRGLYHMASGGRVSRFDVAREIVRLLGVDVEVERVGSSWFAKDYFAARPESEAMRNMVLDLEGNNHMRPWNEALATYLKEWR